MPTILAIESSCDETSAAVCIDGKMLSNVIASQKIHEQYGGVVPELASRAHMQNIVPVVDVAINGKITLTEALLAADLDGVTVQERIAEKVGVIGENISIQNFAAIEGPQVCFYNHNNRSGAIIAMSKSSEEIADLGKSLAMQITAMKPVAVDETSVTEEQKEREKTIAREKAIEEGKPENILDKISEGALNKFYKEFTLLKQEYIKDNKKTIEQVIKETDKEVSVLGFYRTELGSK